MTHLECPRCGEKLDPTKLQNLCECGAPLLVRYDMEAMRRDVSRESLETGRTDMWRFADMLPVPEEEIIGLGEGMTPVVQAPKLGDDLGVGQLLIKDEGTNPTGTFKARGAACGMSMAN
ncbi:MAG: pyridoxal-phosphate dependent enzyme, partial [Bacillota bacterium]